VDTDLRVSVGGWRYLLASTSMQWRARAALQMVMAEIDGSHVLSFDGADILDVPGRNGLMAAVRASGKKALITMTASLPEKVPDLARAKIGNSYFIADGIAQPLGAALVASEAS
jgi:hypothetical protein